MKKQQSIDLSWFDAKKHQPYATHMSFIQVKDMLQEILDNQQSIMSVISADKKFKTYAKKKISKAKVKEQPSLEEYDDEIA